MNTSELSRLFQGQKVVVTGARGFIGSHVARQLHAHGAKVRGLTRSLRAPRPADFPDIEWIEADLVHAPLEVVLKDCRYLFHVAGDYRFWARDSTEIVRNNVLATDRLLTAASNARVEKIVATSTQGILTPGTLTAPGDETRSVDPHSLHGPYKSSKLAAWQCVEKHLGKGLPITTVLPGAPIGEDDLRPTPTGAIIVRFLNGQIPLLARTGLSFADVQEVARGHLLALAHGCIGDRYLLAGHNLWLREFLTLLAPWSRHPVPRKYAPLWASRLAAAASETWHSLIRSEHEPFITRESVRMSEQPYFFSSQKAITALGFTLAPLEPAITRAVESFARQNKIRLP